MIYTVGRRYLAIPNIGAQLHEKYTMLKLLGLEQGQIDEYCRPIEHDRKQFMKEVAEYSRQELKPDERQLSAKLDRERKLEAKG